MELNKSVCHIGIVIQDGPVRVTKNPVIAVLFADKNDHRIFNEMGFKINPNNGCPFSHDRYLDDGDDLAKLVDLTRLSGNDYYAAVENANDLHLVNWVGKAYIKISTDEDQYPPNRLPILFVGNEKIVDLKLWREISTIEAKNILNDRVTTDLGNELDFIDKELG